MSVSKPLTVKEVQAISRRGVNRVYAAANSGALKSLQGSVGQRHLFTEEDVADWIRRGSPEMPPKRRRGAA